MCGARSCDQLDTDWWCGVQLMLILLLVVVERLKLLLLLIQWMASSISGSSSSDAATAVMPMMLPLVPEKPCTWCSVFCSWAVQLCFARTLQTAWWFTWICYTLLGDHWPPVAPQDGRRLAGPKSSVSSLWLLVSAVDCCIYCAIFLVCPILSGL